MICKHIVGVHHKKLNIRNIYEIYTHKPNCNVLCIRTDIQFEYIIFVNRYSLNAEYGVFVIHSDSFKHLAVAVTKIPVGMKTLKATTRRNT